MLKKTILTGLVTAAVFTAGIFAQPVLAADCNSSNFGALAYGQRGERVKNLQSCLIKLGFGIPAGPTGYYGAQTAKALKSFYKTVASMEWHGRNFGPVGISAIKKVLSGQAIVSSSGAVVKKVESAEELKLYLSQARQIGGYYNVFGGGAGILREMLPMSAAPSVQEKSADRVSETTVQVKGIDEPDIVKTDGINIFFSREQRYRILEEMKIESSSLIMPPRDYSSGIDVVKAFPPESLAISTSTIKESGNMLLVKDKKTLVVFANSQVIGYDVSNPQNPQKKWNYSYEDGAYLQNARLLNGKVYFVTQKYVNDANPCPIMPLKGAGGSITIPCREIYRPIRIMPVDTTFTAFVLNPESGGIEKSVSFVGSAGSSALYMSPENLYLTYYEQTPYATVTIDFLTLKGEGLYPADVIARIKNVQSLDIGDAAKNVEVETILQKYLNSLNQDERMRLQNEYANRLADYVKANKRNLEKTNIVKIRLNDFSIVSSGGVPGSPLNQFSLDEYNGNLRIAVTVGSRGFGSGGTANDVYVLDSGMKVTGTVLDLGLTERIYSARFIGDKGYLVTFRQIDPFYVLDLSNPVNPKMTGELKIPGFSSYLEALSADRILGVGEENGKVKLSVFDVSNAASPAEKAKYTLDEGWTEVSNNHHAFLLDDKHKVFFLPGGNGGYVFSYKDDQISLVKTVAGYSVKRAVYLDDYLYIIGENKITVFNELNWEKVKEIEISE